jgi:hypothetical protein
MVPLVWLLVAGISFPDVIIAALVLVAIGMWGLIPLSLLLGPRQMAKPVGLWISGPGVVIGSLLLFMLRLVTSREQFVAVFLVVPIVWVITKVTMRLRWTVLSEVGTTRVDSTQLSLLHFGLTGTVLMAGSGKWPWAAPLVVVVATACTVVSLQPLRRPWVTLVAVVAVALSAVQIRRTTPEFWYREATGIPYDETILETIIHGLVSWGPSTNGLQHTLDGVPSIAYHHLLLLIAGVVDSFIQLRPYQSQAVIGPFIAAYAISSCLLLLVRRWLRSTRFSTQVPLLVQLSLIASVLGLRGAGFSSPTSFFGVAAVLTSLLIISDYWSHIPLTRQSVLVLLSVGAVAFSKGPYIYAPVVIAIALVVYSKFRNWVLAVVGLAAMLLLSTWFSLENEAASEARFNLWPEALFGPFSVNLYGLRVVGDVLVSPLAIGVVCVFVIAIFKGVRRMTVMSVTLILMMLSAVGAKILIYFPQGGEEYWFHPGILASSVSLIYLAASAQSFSDIRSAKSTLLFAIVIAFAGVSLWLEQFGFRALDIASAIFLTGLLAARLFSSRQPESTGYLRGRHYRAAGISAVLLFGVASIGTFSRTQFPEFPSLIRPQRETSGIAWTGTPEFEELTEFVRENTSQESIFASLVCGRKESIYLPCTTDFRPAALMHRRFLMLGKFYPTQPLSPLASQDLTLVQSIGYEPDLKVLKLLSDRNVEYLFLDRSKVSDRWADFNACTGAEEIFRNGGYRLLQLSRAVRDCN